MEWQDRGELKLPTQKKSKNFWLDQISTAGGIIGGIGGSFLSPIAGTAAGAGAGSALGEAIENALMGENLSKNVVKEGALGAVFGAGPLKLLKGAAGGVKALATGADDVIGAASKAAMTPLRQSVGKGLSGAADNLAIKQFRLTPSQLTNYKSKFGEDAGQTIRKYGFTNADDVATKGIQPLQQQFTENVANITGVTKQSLKENLNKRIAKLAGGKASDNRAKAKLLQTEADSILKGYGDVIDAKELNAVRQEFDKLVNYTNKAADPSKYSVNKHIADGIRETLQKADTTGTLKGIGQEISKLKQLSKNVAQQSELGRGSLPFGLSSVSGGVLGGAGGGPLGAAVGMAGQAIANSPTGRKLAMAGAEKLAGKLSAAKGGQSAGGIATRLGTLGAVQGSINQASQPTSLEEALNNQLSPNISSAVNTTNDNTNMPISSNISSSYNDTQQPSNPFGVSSDNLAKAMMLALMNNDTDSFSQLKNIYDMASDYETTQTKNTNASSFGKPTAQIYAQATTGLNSIDQLERMLSENSNLPAQNTTPGQNLPIVGSLISNVAGTNEYRAAAKNILNSIARINTGANMPESEQVFYENTYLPQPGDNQETIQAKLSNLRGFFSPLANYNQYSSGESDLTSALMQAQGAY